MIKFFIYLFIFFFVLFNDFFFFFFLPNYNFCEITGNKTVNYVYFVVIYKDEKCTCQMHLADSIPIRLLLLSIICSQFISY